jgi:hypothetical protein
MKTKAQRNWEEYKRRSRRWAIRIEYGLLHSESYKKLTYAPALKVLNWFHEKLKVDVDKKRRGGKRYKARYDSPISFPYSEAGCRGLSVQQFSKAIKKLHAHGFIDIKQPGSGLEGDYTKYNLSMRWEKLGTPEFEHVEFPYQKRDVKNFGKKGHAKKKPNDESSPLANDEFSPLKVAVNDDFASLERGFSRKSQR